MADQSLDDFFAKKDKSKKKTKSKSMASDVATPQNSSTKKTTTKKKKDDKQPGSSGMVGQLNMEEDQEWHDYEPETEKDYSGLRIQNLQIKSEDDENEENDYNNENDENNETGERRESHSGPWNKSGQQSSTPTPPVIKDEEPAPVVEEAPPSKSTGRYIPPGQRGMGSSMTPTEARMARIRNSKKEAPNIHCELDFPTLGGAGNDFEGKDFERVRGGNRNHDDPSNQNLQLKLNNKYRALQD